MHPVDIASRHRRLNIPPELLWVISEDSRSIMVQGILVIGLNEKKVQTIYNGIDIQDRLPVFTQDIQADISVQVNIRVINLSRALDLGRLVRVSRRNL
jgi:hypothetical protein